MSARYSAHDLDLGVTASPPLPRPVRLGLVLVGLVLTIGAWPLAFVFAVISGGGHGSPFDGGPMEFAFGVAWLAVPLLVLLLGIACLACTNRLRLRLVWALAAAVPAMFVIAVGLGYAASLPRNLPPRPIAAPPPPLQPEIVVLPGGTHVSIACDPVSGECVRREEPLGQPVDGAAVSPNRNNSDTNRS